MGYAGAWRATELTTVCRHDSESCGVKLGHNTEYQVQDP